MNRIALLSVIAACGCSSTASSPPPTPTAGEAGREALTAVCERLAACFPAAFAAAYPEPSTCVERGVAKITRPEEPSACDRAALDVCIADIRAAACAPSAAQTTLPPSCAPC